MAESEILLESGTNELEILELYIDELDDRGARTSNFFGINVAKVMQVIESPGFTHEPGASNDYYLGVISLRNHTVSILDLSVWLGLERAPADNEVVVVTEFSKTVTGFLVSGVTEIHRVGWGEVAPISSYLADMASANIIGTIRREDRFIQLLDLEQIVSELDPTAMNEAGRIERKTERQYRALVVDDSPTIRIMLRKNLSAAGFALIEAHNGEQALTLLRELAAAAGKKDAGESAPGLVDIVISDIEMPLMDGFTLTKNIKSDPALRGLPVILYSSIITKELRHKGESVGADDQIAKPDMPSMADKAIALIESPDRRRGGATA
jgi:chemotaxis signal transduction protein/FixJ family two-component response regulator